MGGSSSHSTSTDLSSSISVGCWVLRRCLAVSFLKPKLALTRGWRYRRSLSGSPLVGITLGMDSVSFSASHLFVHSRWRVSMANIPVRSAVPGLLASFTRPVRVNSFTFASHSTAPGTDGSKSVFISSANMGRLNQSCGNHDLVAWSPRGQKRRAPHLRQAIPILRLMVWLGS